MTAYPAVDRALAADGPLADVLDDYAPRDEQLRMAHAVAAAIEADESLVVEAGTGTGKTLAYLIPALLSGQRVVISTGTRTLQDQLYHRDLPLARDALGRPVRTALLKGRGNYLCLYRMERTLEEGRLETTAMADGLQQLRAWAGRTRSGDLAEAPAGSAEGRLQPRVTSTADNCLGQNCPLYADCFLMEARREAQEADVVVVNHHLLMADWALREGGYGEVLPSADVYILDEAHQLPETAARFFGVTISSRQLQDLVRDTRLEQQREAGDSADLAERAGAVERQSSVLRLTLGDGTRTAWAEAPEAAVEAATDLAAALESLTEALAPQAARGRGLENCHKRSDELHSSLRGFLANESDTREVAWVETRGQGFALRLTPLDVAEHFRRSRSRHGQSWVLTSATLSVNGSFEHFQRRLGVESAQTLQLDSPFDYAANTLLYLPASLPEPRDPRFNEAYLQAVEPVLEASEGRAFMLFTSHRALQQAAEWLRGRGWSGLMVQGDAAPKQLLERFRQTTGAILLGTQSFWEGVDVRGPALSCVMIDRLPFASPGDPVLQARAAWLRDQGRNPFGEYQLPEAIIGLRQGVGRLIRDAADRGVLVLGDSRLVSKPYGRLFRRSLPPMPLVRDLDAVTAFFSDQSSTSS
ncbi:ATP-dependent DNA helicase [Spiribacter vilamensis]|uniref:DNA 5'-3' helicase n=1 Tax=Spiribacter vilamensis TaxID=531306 RepID=A0A4Q8CYS0_9GAMM|nr:ATP-dependent DNA helicase [Spiribacter vilamensis]RZU98047.1 ATP-dependent DNA helicase DinG [Spiribacter vilamensis]TVO61049.1 ATP-dependent DNA helicase [Spiribacter vilamensis]